MLTVLGSPCGYLLGVHSGWTMIVDKGGVFGDLADMLTGTLDLVSFVRSLLFGPLFFFRVSGVRISGVPRRFLFRGLRMAEGVRSMTAVTTGVSSTPSLPWVAWKLPSGCALPA